MVLKSDKYILKVQLLHIGSHGVIKAILNRIIHKKYTYCHNLLSLICFQTHITFFRF